MSGPAVKKVMTKSSRLSVKASSAPATSDGAMCGRITSAMVRFSVTPEVNAASTVLIVLTVLLTAAALKLQGDPAATAGHGAGDPK